VSRRFDLLCIKFKIRTTLFFRFHVRVGILLTRGKHLYDRIITQKGEIWAHKVKLVILLKCPYQVRKVSDHIFVCKGYRCCLRFYDCPNIALNCSDRVLFIFYFIMYNILHSDKS